tara:strand:- start:65 stop:346 length:282 start_codon:yes stop_codon:yes gene_type:complete
MNNEREAQMQEPNPPFAVEIIDTKPVEVKNPFSGEKTTLQPTAVAVYDCIKGAEMLANQQGIDDGGHELWKTVREGLDWFREHYPKEYMVLLD